MKALKENIASAASERGRLREPRNQRRAEGATRAPMNGAFTLLEMLIVIAVIAILALLAFEAFAVSRRNIRMELAAEEVISELHNLRSSAKQSPRCFLVHLKIGDRPRALEVPFDRVASACGTATDFRRARALTAIDRIEISSIKINETPVTSFILEIMPPHGQLSFQNQTDPRAAIELALTENHAFYRTIDINKATGLIGEKR